MFGAAIHLYLVIVNYKSSFIIITGLNTSIVTQFSMHQLFFSPQALFCSARIQLNKPQASGPDYSTFKNHEHKLLLT